MHSFLIFVMSSHTQEDDSITSESSTFATHRTRHLRIYIREAAASEPVRDQKGALIRYCGFENCSYSSPVTTNFRKHLRTKHDIVVEVEPPRAVALAREQFDQLSIGAGVESYDDNPGTALLQGILNKEKIQESLVRLIVRRSIPFAMAEWPEFHSFLYQINPEIKAFLPSSHRTIVRHMQHMWNSEKESLTQSLRTARSKVNISLDIWTSPNTLLFLGIVGHFVRHETNQISKCLLALREIGSHGGEEQFAVLRTVLEEYEIMPSLGVIVGDNSTTNDVLCRTTEKWFEENTDIIWTADANRIRCIGHIINLLVHAFLFKSVEIEDLESYEDQRLQSEIREMGPLGKLHNIVVHIRGSASRTKEFVQEAGKRIPLDNRTRWNSWYNMLTAALSLEKHIDFYVKNQRDLQKDILKPSDWDLLRTTHAFLEIFSSITLQNEGDVRDISESLPSLFVIRMHCLTYKEKLERQTVRTRHKIILLLTIFSDPKDPLSRRKTSSYDLITVFRLGKNGGIFFGTIRNILLRRF